MMEGELRALLRAYGWNMRTRKRNNREYYYAQKWKKDYIYIGAKTNIANITKEQIVEKLARGEAS